MADIGIRGWGPSLNIAFEQAALAMSAVITSPDDIKPVLETHIHCEAESHDILFMDWLNALIYEMSVNKILFSQFDVTINQSKLDAKIRGEKINIKRHQPSVEIKGATFTELKVAKENNGSWIAQCVIDV